MNIKAITNVAKKFAKYGIFMGPLASRLGGGWIGILAGGAIRGLVFSVLSALALYLPGNWELFKWSASAVGFLVYSLLLEIDLSRQKQR
ncbi:hypothetical protein [Burkholderia sp. MSMB1835]|uniref:hypothetical protein n=1 Tax=Burkholderia sp. MSMB1835 TaxID=1637876 RepID=UPI00075C239D|nr:hypothetical protein [Burkholderia sp. MSMB1835]KVL32695.1 hypothetical protein WS96_15370 [Burkholderia sp. MSMB1835]